MKKQAYQIPEIRDASNNIIQAGTYGRTSPLVNADNTGILDYVNNNLEALHDAQTSGNGVRAAADTKGQAIDIAALKKLITDTVTQAKKDAILAAHPVGSYYISDKATDPGTLFGGTWKMLDPGLTLMSQGEGTDKFGSFKFVAGQTYGERMHQLTVDELPYTRAYLKFVNGDKPVTVSCTGTGAEVLNVHSFEISKNDSTENGSNVFVSFGSSETHNNTPTCRAVYIWARTA